MMMNKWIQIWYSWGDHEHPVKVPDGISAWEYMKKLAVNEADVYQEEVPYGCIIWMHPDDQMIELRYLSDNTCCYYLATNEESFDPDNWR